MWKRIHKNAALPSKPGYIGWRLRSQIKRRQIITFRRKITVRKQEKSQLSKFRKTILLTCFGKLHWNTKTCKSEEMSSIVRVLWTNEFDLYKSGDHRRFCAKVKL